MGQWLPIVTKTNTGAFALFVDTPNNRRREFTYYRGVPVKIDSYSSGDPFGDATAQFTFPQITPYDDFGGERRMLRVFANVDLFWVPASTEQKSSRDLPVVNPNTQLKNMWLNYGDKEKVWEGYIVSLEPSDEGLRVQCQGALYQIDRYLAKPSYPPRPVAFDRLLIRAFNPDKQPLMTKSLRREFPDDWKLKFPGGRRTAYKPMGFKKGTNWTGFATRATGAWDRMLTGYIQDLLSQMYTLPKSGVTPGNQWTIRKIPRRKPVLMIRDRDRPPDFSFHYGTPGFDVRLTWDGMNIVNVVYGKGIGEDGVEWNNTDYSNDGTKVSYHPLAAHPRVYPWNEFSASHHIPVETFVDFGNGVTLQQGFDSSEQMLARDISPGWTGEIVVRADPSPTMSMWKIEAGMTVLVKDWTGIGVRLHIAEVTCSPEDGTVTMRVDSRYRDLLTLEQLQARVRDPVTPVKMLQVNRRSVTLNDIAFPWSYSNGAGMVPKKSRRLVMSMPDDLDFPWVEWTRKFPPKDHSEFYVKVRANHDKSKKRWRTTRVLMAQHVTISLSEFACFDEDGEILKIPFHVSVYQHPNPKFPHTGSNYSPFAPNHFQKVGPDGLPWSGDQASKVDFYSPDPAILIGWGWEEQKAGYSPKRSSDEGAQPTGLLVDEAHWDYSAGPKFPKNSGVNQDDIDPVSVTCTVAFYAEHTSNVWFLGRFYRVEPGFS